MFICVLEANRALSASQAHELAAVDFYPKVDCAVVSLLSKAGWSLGWV